MGGSVSKVEEELKAVKEKLNEAYRARDTAQRDEEKAQKVAEERQRLVEQAQRECDEARDRAQQDSSARAEAERMEGVARQREEDAQQAREEAERLARSWEEAAARAERALKVAEEQRRVAEEKLLLGIPPDLRPTTEQMQQFRALHGYGNHALNIALVGESGVGKSALLNAVRGLWPGDAGAAAVGVNETTAVVEGYVDHRHPQVKWFDVPGANTPNISGWLYFMDQNLYIFDALVVLFSDRFTQTVGTLLHNAHRCGIPTYLVRTKADQLIQNLKNDHRGRLKDAQAKRKFTDDTHDMVNKNLLILNLPLQPVFIVSVPGMREWVTDGDATNVMDERVIYQALFPESVPLQ